MPDQINLPLTDFGFNIAANLATDVIKHLGRKGLDSTRLGARLKVRLMDTPLLGDLMDQSSEEQFKKLFLEAYEVYFSRKYRDRQYKVFYEFFASDLVSRAIFDRLFNFQPIDYATLEARLRSAVGRDWILFRLLDKQGLTLRNAIEDFLRCYEERERSASGVAILSVVREIRESEVRITEAIIEKIEDVRAGILEAIREREEAGIPFAPETLAVEPLPPTRGFIGRQVELRYYRRLLRQHNLVIIEGMPGIGKTWIASRLAASQRRKKSWITIRCGMNDSVDGILWDLARFFAVNGDPELFKLLTADKRGDSEYPTHMKVELLLSVLDRDRYLLCFDDFHVVNGDQPMTSFFDKLLGQAKATKFILISRYKPSVSRLMVYAPLRGFQASDVQIFLQRRGVSLDRVLVKQLLAQTRGHPQFLDLFVTWFRSQKREPIEVETFIQEMPLHEATWHYLMNSVYSELTNEEQGILQAISIFRVPESTAAIEVVLENIPIGVTLRRLSNKHIVERSPKVGTYYMHEMLRGFVYTTTDHHRRNELHYRAANYYQSNNDYLEAAYHLSQAGQPEEAVVVLVNGLPSVINSGQSQAALSFLVDTGSDAMSVMIRSLLFEGIGDLRTLNGDYLNAIKAYELAIRGCDDTQRKANIWRKIGNACGYQNEYEKALEYFSKGKAELTPQESFPILNAKIDIDTSYVLMRQRRYTDALASCKQGLSSQKESGILSGVAKGHGYLGDIYYEMGTWDKSIEHYQEAVRLYELLGDVYGAARANNDLGNVYYHRGYWEEAVDAHHRSLIILKRIGDLRQIAMAYTNLGMVYLATGDLDEAFSAHQSSLDIEKRIGNRLGIAIAYNNLGIIERLKGNWEHSLKYHGFSLELNRAMNDGRGIAYSLGLMGLVHLEERNPGAALKCFREAMRAAEDVGFKLGIGFGHMNLAEAYTQTGEIADAFSHCSRAGEIFRQLGAKLEIHKNRCVIGKAYLGACELDKARAHFLEALAGFEELDSTYDVGRVCLLLAGIYCKSRENDQAAVHLARATEIFQKLGAKKDLLTCREIQVELEGEQKTEKGKST